MAVLKMLGGDFEITPVFPSPTASEDAYNVRLWISSVPGQGPPDFYHQYNVVGWQGGHLDIFRMADGFERVGHLENKTLSNIIPTSQAESDTTYCPSDYSELSLHFDIIWLHLIIEIHNYSNDAMCSKATDHIVRGTMFLWVAPDEGYAPIATTANPLVPFVSYDFSAYLHDAQAFGARLKQECIDAQQKRRELNITHFDDFVDFAL